MKTTTTIFLFFILSIFHSQVNADYLTEIKKNETIILIDKIQDHLILCHKKKSSSFYLENFDMKTKSTTKLKNFIKSQKLIKSIIINDKIYIFYYDKKSKEIKCSILNNKTFEIEKTAIIDQTKSYIKYQIILSPDKSKIAIYNTTQIKVIDSELNELYKKNNCLRKTNRSSIQLLKDNGHYYEVKGDSIAIYTPKSVIKNKIGISTPYNYLNKIRTEVTPKKSIIKDSILYLSGKTTAYQGDKDLTYFFIAAYNSISNKIIFKKEYTFPTSYDNNCFFENYTLTSPENVIKDFHFNDSTKTFYLFTDNFSIKTSINSKGETVYGDRYYRSGNIITIDTTGKINTIAPILKCQYRRFYNYEFLSYFTFNSPNYSYIIYSELSKFKGILNIKQIPHHKHTESLDFKDLSNDQLNQINIMPKKSIIINNHQALIVGKKKSTSFSKEQIYFVNFE